MDFSAIFSINLCFRKIVSKDFSNLPDSSQKMGKVSNYFLGTEREKKLDEIF
jgi:hypothetical protein